MNIDHPLSFPQQTTQDSQDLQQEHHEQNIPFQQIPSEIEAIKPDNEIPQSDQAQTNQEEATKSDQKDKKKKYNKNLSSRLIQEANIIQGERLRTRNGPQPLILKLTKGQSQSSDEEYEKNRRKQRYSILAEMEKHDQKKINYKTFEIISSEIQNQEPYESKTPQLLLQFIDDFMVSDKINSLRREFKDILVNQIPNLYKLNDRKKNDDLLLKDIFGQSIIVFSKDQNKYKKEIPKKEVPLPEPIKIEQEYKKNDEHEKIKVPIIKETICSPQKEIFSQFCEEKPTPNKLLNEDFLLDETQGQQNMNSGINYIGEDSNQNMFQDLISDDLLNQLDEQYAYKNCINEELSNMNNEYPRSILNHQDVMLFQQQAQDQDQMQGEQVSNQNEQMMSIQQVSTSIAEENKQYHNYDEQGNQSSQQKPEEFENYQGKSEKQGSQQEIETNQNNLYYPSVFQLNKEMNSDSLIYLSELKPRAKDIINTTTVTSIEVIRERAIKNIYFCFEELDHDFKKLFMYTLYKRCGSRESVNYMSILIEQYFSQSQRKTMKTKVLYHKQQDLQKLYKMDLENKQQVKSYPFIPTIHRIYQNISEYCPEPFSNKKRILEVLKSEKVPVKCPRDCCCFDLNALGKYSKIHKTWNSECPNRRERMECAHHDCMNSQSHHKKQKILGYDVKETLCWGVDQYTQKNIFHILPEDESDEVKSKFISSSLLKAANLLENEGWEIGKVCEFIICNSESKKGRFNRECFKHKIDYMFSNTDRKFAKLIMKAVELNLDQEAFRIHPKGLGVICINRSGIQQNDFITKYIGDIYRPYRWFERQDYIKKYMKENYQLDALPDYYNIMLQIHKNETKGTDILYVDPMQKGNYSSRLNHSCDPNCATVSTIANSNYNLSLYATKSIEYGEELAYDYTVSTESKNDYKQSTCLCGFLKCRGKYLELNNTNQKEHNYILDKIHCFLKRNEDLLRSGNEPLTQGDFNILAKFNFKQNLQSGCEKWLLKWIAMTLKTVQEEKLLFLKDQMESNKLIVQCNKDIEVIQRALDLKKTKGKMEIESIQIQGSKKQHKSQELPQKEKKMSIEKQDQKESSTEQSTQTNSCQQSELHNNQHFEDQSQKQDDYHGKYYSLKSEDIFRNLIHDNNNNDTKVEQSIIVKEQTANRTEQTSRKQEKAKKRGEKIEQKDEEDFQTFEDKERQKEIFELFSQEMPLFELIKMKKSRRHARRKSAIEAEKKAEQRRVVQLSEYLDESQLDDMLKEKQKEREKNIEDIKQMSIIREESRVHNIIVSLDKVKFYLNNLHDKHPPLRYLTPQEMVSNLWGGVAKPGNKRNVGRIRGENFYILSIVEEVIDLLQYSIHHADSQKNLKFFEMIKSYVIKCNKKSPERALLLFRLTCLNIHKNFQFIETPSIHTGALEIMLYFYAFTHTYFAPHEYSMFTGEKISITDEEIFNLELLDQNNKNVNKDYIEKPEEEYRQYSSQFVWGQLTGWFKQTVVNPQATLSQDRRGTLSYPQIHQSFKTSSQTYPFQEKNDVRCLDNQKLKVFVQNNRRQTFLDHVKQRPKDMWPPDHARWSFKNTLRNYGTLLFEGMYSRHKFKNLTERVIDLIDSPFEDQLELFIEVEKALSGWESDVIHKMQAKCFNTVKKELDQTSFASSKKTVEQMERDYQLNVEQKVLTMKQIRRRQRQPQGSVSDYLYFRTKKGRKYESEEEEEEEIEEEQQIEEEEDIQLLDDFEDEQPYEIEEEEDQSNQENGQRQGLFNECILNSEKNCYLEEGADLNEIIQNPQKLRNHLIIQINLAQLRTTSSKFEKEFKSSLPIPSNEISTRKIQKNYNKYNQSSDYDDDYDDYYDESQNSFQKKNISPSFRREKVIKMEIEKKIKKTEKMKENKEKVLNNDNKIGNGDKENSNSEHKNQNADDASVNHSANNENSAQNIVPIIPQANSENQRRSSRATTKIDYTNISKKFKNYN